MNELNRKSHNKTRFWTNGGVFSRSVYKAIYCKQKLDPGDFNKIFLTNKIEAHYQDSQCFII